MISIRVIQKGHRQAIRKLQGLARDVKKPRALYARWGVQALRWIDENFKKQGKLLSGRRWKRMSPATARARRKGRGRGKAQLLQDTGRLKGSFVYKMLSGDRGVAVGTNVSYATTHEYGSVKKNVPQRRMLPKEKDRSFMERYKKTTDNYIKEIIRKSGGGR